MRRFCKLRANLLAGEDGPICTESGRAPAWPHNIGAAVGPNGPWWSRRVCVGSGRDRRLWRAQRPQHIADELRPVARLCNLAIDAQLLVAGEPDVLVLLHQLDDAHGVDGR